MGSPQCKAKSLLLRWWGLPTLRLFQLLQDLGITLVGIAHPTVIEIGASREKNGKCRDVTCNVSTSQKLSRIAITIANYQLTLFSQTEAHIILIVIM